MIRAKLYAILAAIGAVLLATLKIVTMQRDAAREDARRAKKHMTEVKQIRKVEKEINKQKKAETIEAVESIKRGEMPENIRNRNDF